MHCDKNRDFSFSRSLVDCALRVYLKKGWSVKSPVQCLDLSTEKKEGEKWEERYGSDIILMESKININGCSGNDDSHKIPNCESNYIVIEKTDFNFIYVECTTEGSTYFDCVFRKIARNGVFALTTSDDPALYGRPAEPALRCYGGRIVRTFYAAELAVRLILAAMARSAARFSKSIEVLLTMTVKNCITIIVKVRKGADSAVTCLKEVKTLVHCTICEERAFLPENDGFIVDNVQKYLSCSCAEENVGRTMMSLGPLWAGSLGSVGFISDMNRSCDQVFRLPTSAHVFSFLKDLELELRCDRKTIREKSNQKVESECEPALQSEETLIKTNEEDTLKRKADSELCDVKSKQIKSELTQIEPAPAFYYNLHKHKPKGAQHLLKADKVVEVLQRQGFRASRTHFDRAAVKTDATLSNLQSVLSQVV